MHGARLTGLNSTVAAMDGLDFEIWAGGRQSTGRSACATENWAANGGVAASVVWSESKAPAGCRRYKGGRRFFW